MPKMDDKEFSRRLGEISASFSASCFELSLRLARSLKRELIAEGADSGQIGWSLYYEFNSLYELGEYSEACKLLRCDTHHHAIPAGIAARMHLTATELACLLRLPDDMVAFGRRCVELYAQAGQEGYAKCD